MGGNRDDPGDEKERREEAIDETDEIAHHGGVARERSPGVHHHSYAEGLFAGCTTAVQRLEECEVAPRETE